MRNLYFAIILISCLIFNRLDAQQLSTKALIAAWRAEDTSQTTKAEATYADLKYHLDSRHLHMRLTELKKYLKDHPDKRLDARIVIYEILAKRELQQKILPADIANMRHAITIAGLLKDQQLLSEIYSLYANYNESSLENELFYTLKSLDIQREIGTRHFPMVYLRFLIASRTMFITMNYRQSIELGLQMIQQIPSPSTTNLKNYILQLDILGASYRELGMADSVIYYYRLIQETLNKFQLHSATADTVFFKIWRGVAIGGIGQGLFIKKDYLKAIPLLQQNVLSSLTTRQYGDAAMAQNTLAYIDYLQYRRDSALFKWKQAYTWASQEGDLQQLQTAAFGIAELYYKTGRYDSAYVYTNRYHDWKDSTLARINHSMLASTNIRINYDNMQLSLKRAQSTIDRELQLRNILLASLATFTIIALLLYNRFSLKQKLRQETLEKEQEKSMAALAIANQQVKEALRELNNFAANISEKNRMIETLEAQFSSEVRDEAIASLRSFTILTEDNWQQFKEVFEKAHSGFWQRLYEAMPDLTTSEQRYMAMTRLGLNNKEIASATGVSSESIRAVVHRMRKKYNLEDTDHIRTIARNI